MRLRLPQLILVFFFNDPATTEIYTLSLHDALPITLLLAWTAHVAYARYDDESRPRSEEHTSELQSRGHLVCRLLLEKKNKGAPVRGRQRALEDGDALLRASAVRPDRRAAAGPPQSRAFFF